MLTPFDASLGAGRCRGHCVQGRAPAPPRPSGMTPNRPRFDPGPPADRSAGMRRPPPSVVDSYDNATSRRYPAGRRRKLPPAPANYRKPTAGKTCSSRGSPPIPAQPGTTKTGLSRRRSRVRVPSLPLKALQVGLSCFHSSKRSIRFGQQTISVAEPAFRGTTSGPGRCARPGPAGRPVDATIVTGRRGVPPRAPSSFSAEFGPAGGPQGVGETYEGRVTTFGGA